MDDEGLVPEHGLGLRLHMLLRRDAFLGLRLHTGGGVSMVTHARALARRAGGDERLGRMHSMRECIRKKLNVTHVTVYRH